MTKAKLTEIGYELEQRDLPEPCVVCGGEVSKYGKVWRVDSTDYSITGPYCGECQDA